MTSGSPSAPTNVRIHAVSLPVELGDPDETIRLGKGLATSRLPAGIRGRRSALLMDLARGNAMRRMDAAVNTLLEAEQIAAEAVQFNVLVHELLRELLKREHRATTPSCDHTCRARRRAVLASPSLATEPQERLFRAALPVVAYGRSRVLMARRWSMAW
jgi:hypothetical protein